MSMFQEVLKIIEERCGKGKDNIISLATIGIGEDGKPRPYVREVNGFNEDGAFYVTTSASSAKMRQISQNPEVAFAASNQWFYGHGIGENLGWVLDPKNSELRAKLRAAFAAWYEHANDENHKDCVILAIRITSATVIQDFGAIRYRIDFLAQTATQEK